MVEHGQFIDGSWRTGGARASVEVIDPATETVVATVPAATAADLDEALQAADRSFPAWAARPATERAKILHDAASALRARRNDIAAILSREQGKPLAEAAGEVANAADIMDWFAEEARRAYGRIIPARAAGVSQQALREPVGPVAAFSPWNFPVSQAVRKMGAALAAGCTIIIKGPEEAPGAVCEVVRTLAEAGVPAGALNLVFGDPPAISAHLIPAPQIRKVSFTGSVAVGKQLAALAGQHMKRTTMELGGHAPVIVFDDVEPGKVATQLAAYKYRNGGQICISPTRFYVHEKAYDAFLEAFVAKAKSIRVGAGSEDIDMGPLATRRRVDAIDGLVSAAVQDGATLHAGGRRLNNVGYFYAPTVLGDVPAQSPIMNEEPFGPVALINRFEDEEDVIARANSTPYGLAGYAFTDSSRRAALVSARVRVGMMSINHLGLGPIETPFGGVGDSGHGREGGSEGLDAYLETKFVSHLAA
ncbi:NAD-dependent succinate-semialdehyde dehydrogenase [Arvimicrobium flavum]|uniref:NAD-dependent succinate-semialdehyde dehydrogenase n=1 Tax=Arvimicrobium flavum TaxID=3393320 RepID=UPI00237A89AC|nr:NAD-dependent succinate-semialdehyde dehydrogenase [Mesorhizobium shangrilense]